MGLKTGIDLAFLLMGLIVGADQSTDGENIFDCCCALSSSLGFRVTRIDLSSSTATDTYILKSCAQFI